MAVQVLPTVPEPASWNGSEVGGKLQQRIISKVNQGGSSGWNPFEKFAEGEALLRDEELPSHPWD